MPEGWEIEWTSAARRTMGRLPEKVAVSVAEFVAGPLLSAPQRVGKALKLDLESCHAARRGEHRIIYEIHEEQRIILLLRIEHRRDVYRSR